MSIADKLEDLVNAKLDIKTVLNDKGVPPTGGLSTYADAIDRIDDYSWGFYNGYGSDVSNSNIFPKLKYAPKGWMPSYIATYQYRYNEPYAPNDIGGMGEVVFGAQNWKAVTLGLSGYEYLVYVPKMEIGSNSMYGLCYQCYSLLVFGGLKGSTLITSTEKMFQECFQLRRIEPFDTSNVKNMSSMFNECYQLKSIPHFNTSNVTDMSWMFYACYSLTTIPQFDTSNVTDMSWMFDECDKLKSVPLLDCSKVTSVNGMFRYCLELEHLEGLKNLGKMSSLKCNSMFDYTDGLSRTALINLINNLYDRAAAGYSILTIKLGTTMLNRLTDEDIAIATNKGWNLS